MLKNKKSLKTKLIWTVIGALSTLSIVAAAGIIKLKNIEKLLQYENKLTDGIKASERARFHLVQIQQYITDASLTGEGDSLLKTKENLIAYQARVDELIELFPDQAEHLTPLKAGGENLYNTGLEMAKGYRKSKADGDEIMKRPKTGLDARSEIVAEEINKQVEFFDKQQGQSSLYLQAEQKKITLTALGAALFLILLISASMYSIFKQVEPLDRLTQDLESGASVLQKYSKSITDSSKLLNASSESQSSAIEETAASMTEISSMLNKTSDVSIRLQESAEQSGTAAESGRKAIERLFSAMSSISESSENILNKVNDGNQKISEIVSVISEIGTKTKIINDIVFQTKLLSFNASVEAARAGEHGKGFAVVAEEVGNLAEMSGGAAKEISTILNSSIQRVSTIVSDMKKSVETLLVDGQQKTQNGINVAKECGTSLEQIVNQVQDVNGMISEITSAIQEQSQGVSEISKAINQLEKTTSQNLGIARETSIAAESLVQQSNTLQDMSLTLSTVISGSLKKKKQMDLEPLSTPLENIEKQLNQAA